MKYVAFLDVLGFKSQMKKMKHGQAIEFIRDFSEGIYKIWGEFEHNINGFIVSDSVILYTNDTSIESLNDIMKISNQIIKRMFVLNNILIRGAITQGEFDKLPAVEVGTLAKGLIVGEAYIRAYLLEESVGTTGLIISPEVMSAFGSNSNYSMYLMDAKTKGEEYYVLKWIDAQELIHNMDKFIKMANGAKWSQHYYRTIRLAVFDEEQQIVEELITKFLIRIRKYKNYEGIKEQLQKICDIDFEYIEAIDKLAI